MITYILQAILFQLLFLLVYEILLKKETFFSYNRWYLLTTAIVSLLLPFIQIETLSILVPETALSQIPTIFLPEVYIGSEAAAQRLVRIPTNEIRSTVSILNYWLVIYLAGVFGALVILLKKYNNLSRMFRFKKIAAEGRITIIQVPNSSIAFSFYRTIFLGDEITEAEKQQILFHELVHIKQQHSLDLLFFEVLKVIFWFNPLTYIYQSRITTLHEFIADEAVVKATGKRNYYEQLLNSAFNSKNISFINQFFNHSLIKKRIVMLQRSRSKTILKFKYLLSVPLILVMLTYVACSDGKTVIKESAINITELDDESMRKMYLEQIKQMEESGASETEINNTFYIALGEVQSKEDFYKSQTYLIYLQNKSFHRKKVEGNLNEKDEKRFNDKFKKFSYEDFLAQKGIPPILPPPPSGDNEFSFN